MASSVLTRHPNAGAYGKDMVNIDHNQDLLVDPLLGVSYQDDFTPRYTAPGSTLLQSGSENPWGHLDMPYGSKLMDDEFDENHTQFFPGQDSPRFDIAIGTPHPQHEYNIASQNQPPQDDHARHTHTHTHLTRAATRQSSSSSSQSPALSTQTSHQSSASFLQSTVSSASSPDRQQQPKPAQSRQGRAAPKRKPRTRKRSSLSEEAEGPQRNKFLERNRVAASKCRQKKKEWAHDLEGTKASLEAQNMELHSEYDELLEQVTRMKNSLLSHATCNDPIIDGWIEVEARKYVVKSIRQRQQGLGHFDGFGHNDTAGLPQQPRHSISHTIGSSNTDGYPSPPSARSLHDTNNRPDQPHIKDNP